MLSKISEMSKIGSIIYRAGLHNLHTRTVLFSDQEKLLEKLDDG